MHKPVGARGDAVPKLAGTRFQRPPLVTKARPQLSNLVYQPSGSAARGLRLYPLFESYGQLAKSLYFTHRPG